MSGVRIGPSGAPCLYLAYTCIRKINSNMLDYDFIRIISLGYSGPGDYNCLVGECKSHMRSAMERITIFDTTLRDGEQSPGCSMSISEKLQLARSLDALGVDVIEAGFPVASDGDFSAVQRISREIRRPTIAALARCKEQDVRRAGEAVRDAERPRIHTFLATSSLH